MHHIASGNVRLLVLVIVIFLHRSLLGQVAEQTVVSTSTLNEARIYSGEGFIAVTPNSGSLHRNSLVVYNGATLTLGSEADVWVKNDDNHTTFLRIGYYNATGLLDGTGVLDIGAGAVLRVGQASRYANFHVGEGAGNTGAVNQSGGDVTVLGSFNVGVDGGSGSYTLNGGTFTLNHDDNPANKTSLATIGLNLNPAGVNAGTSTGSITINGGTLNLLAHEWDSSGHPGEYGSVALILGNRDRGAASYGEGNGELIQNGGIFHVDPHAGFYLSSVGNGAYSLNGGTLEIGGASLRAKYGNGPGTYQFNLSGGTIAVTGAALDTSVNATLTSGTTSTFHADDFNATWRGSLTGSGSLLKTGTKTLSLTGGANNFGGLDVRTGTLQLSTGSTTVTRALIGANGTGANGTLEISGGVFATTGSSDADFRTTYIGAGASNTGNLILSSGTLNIGSASTPAVRADFEVGSFSGTGSAIQTGGSLNLNSTGGYFHVGNQGTGAYTLQAGSVTVQNAFVLGRSTASGLGDGTLSISGGTLTLASATKGALIVGGVDASNTVTGGKGTINQSGGTVKVGQYLELGTKGGSGIYNLTGGTLELGGTGGIKRDASGTYQFNFGGGTLKIVGTALTSGLDFNFADFLPSASAYTQSFIDTNGLGATFSGALTGEGTLVKQGSGTLSLSGANAINGEFYVTGGVIAQTAGASSIRYLAVASGAGTSGSYSLSAGSLSVGNTLQVGDWGGTGSFTQTGGALTVNGSFNVGNQGGTGTYNLSAGTLTLSNGLYNLGRNTGANPASTGTINLSGGMIEVASGNFILGNRDATAATGNGAGTLNQTGGVMRITGSSGSNNLFLSAYGNGTYNLNAGALEIGGDHLRERYSGAGSYAFNLGGGTIKVIGSTLTTSVAMTLTAGTTSTINTNNLGAVFSGGFNGSGNLTKSGAGQLTLSGTHNFSGNLTVSEGNVRVSGSAPHASITVNSGTTFSGNGAVGNLNVLSGGNLFVSDLPGTLTVTGDLSLASGSMTQLQLTSLANYDRLIVGGTFFAGGILTFNAASQVDLNYATSFTLFQAHAIAGTFSEVRLPSLSNGFTWDLGSLYSSGVLRVNAVSAIPEPATWATILGGVALALSFLRGRFQAKERGGKLF